MSQNDEPFSDREPVKQVPTNVVLPVLFREQLRYLARATRVPQAVYIREAIQDLLNKYGQLLDNSELADKRES